jgi:uncharacterized protein YbjT (DUF2867 family)
MTRSAWIAGATGLVGLHLVDALLEDPTFASVVTLGRRPVPRSHAKLTQVTVDFTALDPASLPPVTDAFCTLGTTIGKAGSREAFRAVDHDAVLAFARAAKARGASHGYVVTALGADARSWVFYNRVKGEVEAALQTVGFEGLVIVRPSLLLGERAEHRPGERLAIQLSSALKPLLAPLPWRPIEAAVVARALRTLARTPPTGVRIYPSGELHALGAA